MVNYNLSPSQLILMIFAIEFITGVVISVVANSIINGYFKAKESHVGRMAKAFCEMLQKIGESLKTNKKEEKKNESDQV